MAVDFSPEDLKVIETRQFQCDEIINKSSNILGLFGPYCPGRFDGWSCWPSTPAGEIANQSCPAIMNYDPNRLVFYKCEEDGTWIFNEKFNKSWVNYTTCINIEDFEFRQQIILIYCVGYGVSLVALLVSLALLTYFKSLRCARITVHMNLFSSFAMNNFLWLLWYSLVVNDQDVLSENKLWCRVLHVVLFTFLISNYSWMLCEGIYLHTVLVSAFISERRLLRCMLALGWGIPLLTTSIYAPVRSVLGENVDELGRCWIQDGRFNKILMVPVVITVFLNVIFLVNIVRVLLIKLRKGPANGGSGSGASRTSLQALRATMLLVPLLGLNFLLTPFRPEANHPWEYVYEVVSAMTASLQGLCVAILFCFCNGEVIAQVKRKWRTIMFRPRANSCTVTTVSFVRSSYPANGEEKV
ncbi:calcitonin gene-related peptide type 1 receptor isoform X2 [Tribolium madens]|uniref:calcitonin gene-related peptide type 1 receptor isoform X2 n=1 Tax=Tribolium madens TaxID=41895 RepID=UPI001CF73516|nr:calcitonin gene-related peptide type 1 receptor isoform X2 [Tribolium madens]